MLKQLRCFETGDQESMKGNDIKLTSSNEDEEEEEERKIFGDMNIEQID